MQCKYNDCVDKTYCYYDGKVDITFAGKNCEKHVWLSAIRLGFLGQQIYKQVILSLQIY